jgi:hypothetical protein
MAAGSAMNGAQKTLSSARSTRWLDIVVSKPSRTTRGCTIPRRTPRRRFAICSSTSAGQARSRARYRS